MPSVTISITTYRASDTLDNSTWYAWADNGLCGIGSSEDKAVKDVLNSIEDLYNVNCGATRVR